jgi:tetratricopeptide (TPR) repeat protein
MRVRVGVLSLTISLFGGVLSAETPELQTARDLYHHTAYRESLAVLLAVSQKDDATLQLIGQDYFMLAEYKKATESLEKAAVLAPDNSQILLWLGRAYGRRAESSSLFTAPSFATKARQMFERAVALDPANKEATGDLLDFYLGAPGFLGGGEQKAQGLVNTIGRTDPAEGHYAQALIDDHRKQYDAAEKHFRHALELAPKQVGRIVDLAKFLAKRGRIDESEAMFDRATKLAPNNPRLLFEHASVYVKEQRNLDEARQMLRRYLQAPLTADDPPREEAQALLKKIGNVSP